jgi:hypothetical protein
MLKVTQHTIFDQNGNIVEVEGPLEQHYKISRMKTYNIGHQLNCLYDDIQAGVFGEAAKSGLFAAEVERVKQLYPAPPKNTD